MPYTPDTWADLDPTKVVSAARMTKLGGQYAAAMADSKAYTDRLAISLSSDMSQAALQAALNAVAVGTKVTFTPGTYTLTGPLTVAVNSTFIDAHNATFVQTTWGQPGFDAIGRNGCTFDIGMVQFSGTRGGQGSSYRGSSQYCSGAGVWINGDYNFVRYLKTSYMPVGVFLSSWAGTSTYDHVGVGNRIGIIESDHANWGLLYVGQQDLIVDDIYAHDDLDDSAGVNPTHVVYCSATTSFRSTGGEFRAVRAKNILTGQPVQIKFHDGLRIGNIAATNCAGLLNVIDSNDLQVGGYSSLGTLANSGQGSITFQRSVTNSQRPRLGRGYLQLNAGVDERAVNIISDYGVFDHMAIDSAYDGSATAVNTPASVVVRGTGNRFIKPIINNTGAFSAPGFYVGFAEAANNTVIDGPQVAGVSALVRTDAATTVYPVLVYDPRVNSWTGTQAVIGNSTRTAPRALTPYDFGAVEPVTGSDNTAALSALFAAAAGTAYPSGAEIYLPPGLWRYNSSTGLPLNSNTVIRGAGRRSRLVTVGTSNLFEWTTSVSGVNIQDLYLESAAAGKAIFGPGNGGGIFSSTIRQCFLIASTDTSRILNMSGTSQTFIGVTIQDCEMQRTTTSSVVPFNIVNSAGAANFNEFNQVRINGSNNTATPFFHFESTLVGTYMTDWTFINILGEQNTGGMLTALAAYNWKLLNVTDEDSTAAYTANLIDFRANGNALGSRNINIENSGRRGQSMTSGKFDISVDPSTSTEVTIINCNPTPVSGNSLLNIPLNSVVFGTRGYPTTFQGTGAPAFAAVVGSLYLRQDGGTSTTLYVKESGTGNTGWVAK